MIGGSSARKKVPNHDKVIQIVVEACQLVMETKEVKAKTSIDLLICSNEQKGSSTLSLLNGEKKSNSQVSLHKVHHKRMTPERINLWCSHKKNKQHIKETRKLQGKPSSFGQAHGHEQRDQWN